MNDVDVYAFAQARIDECECERHAYGSWLRRLKQANLMTVLVPLALSSIAGAAIVGNRVGTTATFIGFAALLGALLSAVHTGLKCEAHQAECRRLQSAFCGLRTRYESLFLVGPDEANKQLLDIERQLALLHESVQASVPARYRAQDRDQRDNERAGGLSKLIQSRIRAFEPNPSS